MEQIGKPNIAAAMEQVKSIVLQCIYRSGAGENPLLNFYIPPFFENNEVFLVFRIYITAKRYL